MQDEQAHGFQDSEGKIYREQKARHCHTSQNTREQRPASADTEEPYDKKGVSSEETDCGLQYNQYSDHETRPQEQASGKSLGPLSDRFGVGAGKG